MLPPAAVRLQSLSRPKLVCHIQHTHTFSFNRPATLLYITLHVPCMLNRLMDKSEIDYSLYQCLLWLEVTDRCKTMIIYLLCLQTVCIFGRTKLVNYYIAVSGIRPCTCGRIDCRTTWLLDELTGGRVDQLTADESTVGWVDRGELTVGRLDSGRVDNGRVDQ